MGQGTNVPPKTAGLDIGWSGPNWLGGPGEGGPNPIDNPVPWTQPSHWKPTPWMHTMATDAFQQEFGKSTGYKNSPNVLEGNFLMREAMHNALRFDPATGRMHAGPVNTFVRDPSSNNQNLSGHYMPITDPRDPRYWNIGPMSRYTEGALAGLERQFAGKKKQWKV